MSLRLTDILSNETSTSSLKLFDSTSQTESNNCGGNMCPGVFLPTPNRCICSCGNGFILNASGTKCMQQANFTDIDNCPSGKYNYILADIIQLMCTY